MPSDRVIIAVATCERPGGVSYLTETLNSMAWDGSLYDVLAGAGEADTKVVDYFAMNDGPLTNGPGSLALKKEGKRLDFALLDSETNLGDRGNLWRILRLVASLPNWDRLLFFEDDILFLGKHSLLRMMTCPFLADDGLITFHDMKELNADSPYGLHRTVASGRDLNGLWGLQAAAFKREVVEHLVSKDHLAPWANMPRTQSDRVVEHYLKTSRWPYVSVHCPSLVRHVGAVSVSHPHESLRKRQSRREAPPDFDSGLLIGRPEIRF